MGPGLYPQLWELNGVHNISIKSNMHLLLRTFQENMWIFNVIYQSQNVTLTLRNIQIIEDIRVYQIIQSSAITAQANIHR